MAMVEQMELVRKRNDIDADVRKLIEKYRTIFSLEVPELDKNAADKLILVEIQHVLDNIRRTLPD